MAQRVLYIDLFPLEVCHDELDTRRRGDGSSVLVAKPTHSRSLRLLLDHEPVRRCSVSRSLAPSATPTVSGNGDEAPSQGPQLTCISAQTPRRLSRRTAVVFGSAAGARRGLSMTRSRDRGFRCSACSRCPSTGTWAPSRAAVGRGHGRLGGRATAAAPAGGSGASAWAYGAAAGPSADGAWPVGRQRPRRPSAKALSAGIAMGPWRRVEAGAQPCRRLGTGSSSRAGKRVRGRGFVGFADWSAEILSTRPRLLGRNVASPCLGPAFRLVPLSRRGALGVICLGPRDDLGTFLSTVGELEAETKASRPVN